MEVKFHPCRAVLTPRLRITTHRGGRRTYFFDTCQGTVLFAEKIIMGYTSSEKELATHFRGGMTEGIIPGTGVRIMSCMFHSSGGYAVSDGKYVPAVFRSLFRSGELERRNSDFTYFIMTPGESTGKGAIILLHGLNERSWLKYIQWGVRLATDTGRPVVLFPSAYHMNRSPQTWIDRHNMMPMVTARTSMMPDIRLSSFVNVALSTRMTASPYRFMISGYQTITDLASLISSVREGSHPDLPGGGPVDIFAYSIGALATQVMMLSDPSPLPDDSRVMFFCGGSSFSLMNGTSRLIMDSRAFDKLLSFYLEWDGIKKVPDGHRLIKIMNDTPEGEAFFAMTSLERLQARRGTPFSKTDGRFKAVTLDGDRVIPPEAVSKTLTGADLEVWDPGYACTHEIPFPVLAGEKSEAVDRTFDRLFDIAGTFLS